MPHESDLLGSGQKTEAPKPDVDLNKELVRIRAQEKEAGGTQAGREGALRHQ